MAEDRPSEQLDPISGSPTWCYEVIDSILAEHPWFTREEVVAIADACHQAGYKGRKVQERLPAIVKELSSRGGSLKSVAARWLRLPEYQPKVGGTLLINSIRYADPRKDDEDYLAD